MPVTLDQIAPWGRSCREYELMFGLNVSDLSSGILDCGGGPASFNAEMTDRGHRVVSVDPVYTFSTAQIRTRFEETAETMLAQVRATSDDWVWTYHRDPDDLLANRRAALERFLADFDCGLREHRYVPAELPALPFRTGAFGLALCSHLLFLYSELLTAEFHIRSVMELCRLAREVRIFPLFSLDGKRSRHVARVQTALTSAGWNTKIESVAYEFRRGGNEMLRVFRP